MGVVADFYGGGIWSARGDLFGEESQTDRDVRHSVDGVRNSGVYPARSGCRDGDVGDYFAGEFLLAMG